MDAEYKKQAKIRMQVRPLNTKIRQGQITDKHMAEMAVLQDEIPSLLFMQSLTDELTPGVVKSIKEGTFAKCLSNFAALLVTPDDSWVMRRFKAKAKVDARFLNMNLPAFKSDPFSYEAIDTYIAELSEPDPSNNQLSYFDRLIGRTGRKEDGGWNYTDGPSSSWEQELMEQYICELLHLNALADTSDVRDSDSYKRRYQIVEGVNAALVTWLASNATIEAKREGLSPEDMALQNEISGSSVHALQDDTSRWEWWKSHAKQFGESVKEFSWTSLFK